ncbi:hypothetical protein [Hymenobacter fastidiosus]|uniref:hypothetical protein n=1 Tax=Hymenobacter fastidiosus TaxID=486264 RepID=UPI0031EC597B
MTYRLLFAKTLLLVLLASGTACTTSAPSTLSPDQERAEPIRREEAADSIASPAH